MREREWQIGITGTFDVENYGDMLFPIIAEAELRERLGRVRMHPFSYSAKTPPDWPYAVRSVAELPQALDALDAMLIGGGFLVRFDKLVAENYGPPSAEIHHPTGYWLTPALMAAARGIPVAWNAPGMHCNDIPLWAEPLLRLALAGSAYVSVRDEPSGEALAPYAEPGRVRVVPDSGFGLGRLIPAEESAEMQRVREVADLRKPYIVVQPVRWADDGFPAFLQQNASRFASYQLLGLPMGPVLGDSVSFFGDALPHFTWLPFWPSPLLLAEIIGNAAAVIGYSYHLVITALAAGVPAFASFDQSVGKFTALSRFETLYRLASINEAAPDVFFSRLGRTEPAPSVRATLPPLARHWDEIAKTVEGGRGVPHPAFASFWQSLPNLLENPSR